AVLLQAMRRLPPTDRDRLYWAARLSLVNRAEDLGAFDAVFAAVFDGATLGVDPPSLHRSLAGAPVAPAPAGTAGSSTVDAEGLPWATRPAAVTASADTGADTPTRLPDLLPSHITARADEPFERFDTDDLRLLGGWLVQAVAHSPRRRSLRRENHLHGMLIDLRRSSRASLRTRFETLRLPRSWPRRGDSPVLLFCDASRSMQP